MIENSKKAIEKIHEFERFGSILGLERMNDLLKLLGNPHEDLKVIHVAGTNGKGSVCRYIYSVLRAAGYKTGIYISPFIEIFNERIELDGEYISDEDLALYTDRVLGWKLVRWNESCGSAGKAFGSDEQSLFHSLDGLFSSVPVFLFPWVRGDRPCGDLQPEKPPPWRRTRFRQVGRCVPNRQEIPG